MPKLLPDALCSTQLSRSAPTVAARAGRRDGPRADGRRLVDVAGGVDRAHADLVRRRPPGRCTGCGDVQARTPPPSSEHWNVEPASLEENVNVALVLDVEPVGPESIVVSRRRRVGHDRPLRGSPATRPRCRTASIARTRNSCAPSARFVYAFGERARGERRAVERALERRPGLVGGERERRVAVRGRARRAASRSSSAARVKSGAPNVSTSCGGLLPASRLSNCCSASPFSRGVADQEAVVGAAAYIARTCAVTFHSR